LLFLASQVAKLKEKTKLNANALSFHLRVSAVKKSVYVCVGLWLKEGQHFICGYLRKSAVN
jgi:hypothetical protein